MSVLGELGKLDEAVYQSKCLSIVNDLWAMSDRAVRTCLLKACKYLIPLTPVAVVSKNIFDAILAGFADTNSKYVSI